MVLRSLRGGHWLAIIFNLCVSACATSGNSHSGRTPAQAEDQIVIGMFGDIHENMQLEEKILKAFKKQNVNYVIGTGDFINWGGPAALEEVLSRIGPISDVPKEHIFLMPGNWEHETGYSPNEMNGILARYGNLVYQQYDRYGFVLIGTHKIMVSHFPQHAIPDEMMPPPQFRTCTPAQACLLETITRGVFPTADVEFEVFGHTHRFGSYLDENTHKVSINVGTLHPTKKIMSEPSGYAIYSSVDHSIRLYDVTSEALVRTIELSPQTK